MKFLNKFDLKKNIRFDSFKETLRICSKRNAKIFVETGTSRGKTKFFFIKRYNWKDGMSTPIFAEYAFNVNGELHTCDISLQNINNAKKFTKNFSKNVFFHNKDSLIFLKNFYKPIDLLYLDSLDGHDVTASSNHQLNEIKIGINKLHDRSLVLLDDKGTKTKLSVNFLQDSNYKIIYETNYQILFSKK